MLGAFFIFSIFIHNPVPLVTTPWGSMPLGIIVEVTNGINKRRRFTRKGRKS